MGNIINKEAQFRSRWKNKKYKPEQIHSHHMHMYGTAIWSMEQRKIMAEALSKENVVMIKLPATANKQCLQVMAFMQFTIDSNAQGNWPHFEIKG